jgi:hypothetical protein
VQVVRFYVPALGAIALLGAWLVTRIPGHAWRASVASAAVITAMFGLGVWSFYAMYAAFGVPLRGYRSFDRRRCATRSCRFVRPRDGVLRGRNARSRPIRFMTAK